MWYVYFLELSNIDVYVGSNARSLEKSFKSGSGKAVRGNPQAMLSVGVR